MNQISAYSSYKEQGLNQILYCLNKYTGIAALLINVIRATIDIISPSNIPAMY